MSWDVVTTYHGDLGLDRGPKVHSSHATKEEADRVALGINSKPFSMIFATVSK